MPIALLKAVGLFLVEEVDRSKEAQKTISGDCWLYFVVELFIVGRFVYFTAIIIHKVYFFASDD